MVYGRLKPGADTQIKHAIGDICVSMKAEDYLELPDITYSIVPVELDAKARKNYKTLERDMLLPVDDTEITVAGAAALSNKLLQLANGALYDENKEVHPVHDAKLDALEELMEGLQGQPALVFYSFKHDIDRVVDRLGKKYRVRVYKDSKDADDWNAGKLDVLLAHPASTAYGLNLQAGGHNVVWFGLNWSLELYQQANARLYRQGQDKPVVVHHLVVQDSIDMDVIDALDAKKDGQDALLDAIKARVDKIRRNG